MTILELSGSSESAAESSGAIYAYYRNGMQVLIEEGEDWLRYWPSYAHNGKFVRAMAESIGLEFGRIRRAREAVAAQLHVNTATWGLKYWEVMLGLPLRTDTAWSERRTVVLTALAADGRGAEFDRLDAVLADLPLWAGRFLLGLDALTGTTSTITLGHPDVAPYTMNVEVGVQYNEDAPSTAPTAAVSAAPGSVPIDTYTYKVAFQYTSGVTLTSAASGAVVLGTIGAVQLSNIPSGVPGCTARLIYRKGVAGTYQLVGTLAGNDDTLFTDTAAAGGDPEPGVATAITPLGQKIDDYIARAKPAHISVEVTASSFRAGINVAGDPV